MTSNDPPVTQQSWLDKLRAKLDPIIPASTRETAYRVVAAITMALAATGLTSADKVTLWIQLGLTTVTLVYALLYSGSSLRTAFYGVITAGAAILLAYGIAQNVNWAIIVASVGQALGVATAAAKAQPPESA